MAGALPAETGPPSPTRRAAVRFEHALSFTDGSEHRVLGYVGGSRFRDAEGRLYRVPNWQDLAYGLLADD